ncbi:polymorphic toxin type 27 domain-containing protein [Planotetraspora kaengkrachanensis]|uniref:Bacterial toxin 27 domain-containing protein n=1 Tax=Planotetraspora kaengkrachanensis TaxID=575193 RepID=A0A8J3PZX8_9ACTN|nr:hypothetical protein Pka01_73380 [Planotetraspora kaengkrachanensis]
MARLLLEHAFERVRVGHGARPPPAGTRSGPGSSVVLVVHLAWIATTRRPEILLKRADDNDVLNSWELAADNANGLGAAWELTDLRRAVKVGSRRWDSIDFRGGVAGRGCAGRPVLLTAVR